MGCLDVDGSLELGESPAWRLEASVEGRQFQLADLPDLRAAVSPELGVEATPEAWFVGGTLGVREALVRLDDVPRGAVRPAEETVVHGLPAPEEDAALPLTLMLEARLGDVRFEGLGLQAQLDGVLDLKQSPAESLLVEGTTTIEEGTFSAYGQTLTIERGQLLFQGAPDNPSLDLRATREVEGGTVGLEITGTARAPRSEIFSDPALSESEALARLLTGRSLQSAGAAADPQALERAALGLGIRRALPALDRIGSRLGLDELGVDTPSGEDGALVAGKQLGEDVYLRYKHGLFDDFAGLELIYRITDRFQLHTETGTAQSLDLIYQVGREAASLADAAAEYLEGVESPADSSVATPPPLEPAP
jgi:translocation and assembly module TamB